MRKNTLKAAAVALLAGTVLQFGGGCLGGIIQQAVLSVVAEQLAGFFPDIGGILGGGEAAQ